jgi:hypothetical protein
VRAAVVGHVEWIEFVAVEHLPRAGEIVAASETWQEAGGGGTVAAVQLSPRGFVSSSRSGMTSGAARSGTRPESKFRAAFMDARAQAHYVVTGQRTIGDRPKLHPRHSFRGTSSHTAMPSSAPGTWTLVGARQARVSSRPRASCDPTHGVALARRRRPGRKDDVSSPPGRPSTTAAPERHDVRALGAGRSRRAVPAAPLRTRRVTRTARACFAAGLAFARAGLDDSQRSRSQPLAPVRWPGRECAEAI